MEQGNRLGGLEVAPQLEGAAHERDVGRVLVVGEPDDPGEPV